MNPLITFDLLEKIETELLDIYADVDIRVTAVPTPADVIADVLREIVRDLNEEARAVADCNKVDTCTAKAIAYRHIAAGLAELAAEVARDGLPLGEVEGA
jgi:hypothetical protein